MLLCRLLKSFMREEAPTVMRTEPLQQFELAFVVKWYTFASHPAMRGVPLKAVQELLGHSTMDMTMRYAHLSPDARRGSVRLLDGLGTYAAREPRESQN